MRSLGRVLWIALGLAPVVGFFIILIAGVICFFAGCLAGKP